MGPMGSFDNLSNFLPIYKMLKELKTWKTGNFINMLSKSDSLFCPLFLAKKMDSGFLAVRFLWNSVHWEKFCNTNDTFQRVVGILVNVHVPEGIWTRIARYPRQNIILNVTIFYDHNDSLKSVVYVAEFGRLVFSYSFSEYLFELFEKLR